jgi:hypothetical protein
MISYQNIYSIISVFSKLDSKKFDLDPINYPYEDESINEEMKYIDLIETDNCKIVSENGSIENIQIPVFGHDNTMNWRLNFST